MRVIHVAPSVFGPDGLYGGGERYPLELARAPGRPNRLRVGHLWPAIRHVAIRHWPAHPRPPADDLAAWPPCPAGGPAAPRGAHPAPRSSTPITSVSVPTRMSAVTARVLGVGTAVIDHGLLGRTWGGLLHRCSTPSSPSPDAPPQVLGAPGQEAGDPRGSRYAAVHPPCSGADRDGDLFVGRLTPHKGIDRSIRALPAGAALRIAGRSGHDPRPRERDYPALLRRLAQGQDVTFLGPVPDSARPACTDEPRSWPSLPSTVPATAGTSPCGSCSAWWRLRAWPVGPRWSPAGSEAWPRSFSGSPGGPVPSDAWPPTRRRRSAGALRAHGRGCRLLPAALPYSCLTAAKAAVSVSATGTPVASSACR